MVEEGDVFSLLKTFVAVFYLKHISKLPLMSCFLQNPSIDSVNSPDAQTQSRVICMRSVNQAQELMSELLFDPPASEVD